MRNGHWNGEELKESITRIMETQEEDNAGKNKLAVEATNRPTFAQFTLVGNLGPNTDNPRFKGVKTRTML